MNASGIITDPVRDMYALAVLFAILIFVIAVLWIIARLSRKPEAKPIDPLIAEMHKNLDEVAKARTEKLLREYWDLSDRATEFYPAGGLSAEETHRLAATYAELRNIYPYPMRFPRRVS